MFNPQIFKYFRYQKGTQQTVAEALNTTVRTVRNWELGATAPFKTETAKGCNIHQIAAYFETEIDIFYLSNEAFAKLIKTQTQLPNLIDKISELLFIDFFQSNASTDVKERSHALRVIDKLMPVLELMALEDSANTTQDINTVVDMDRLIKLREQIEKDKKDTAVMDETDTDQE